jgi:hypothetical protein
MTELIIIITAMLLGWRWRLLSNKKESCNDYSYERWRMDFDIRQESLSFQHKWENDLFDRKLKSYEEQYRWDCDKARYYGQMKRYRFMKEKMGQMDPHEKLGHLKGWMIYLVEFKLKEQYIWPVRYVRGKVLLRT